MIIAYQRGWQVYFDGINWRYTDNDKIFDDSRPCKKCGKYPTKEGYDACLGYIDGAIAACCGHGVEKGYVKFTRNSNKRENEYKEEIITKQWRN